MGPGEHLWLNIVPPRGHEKEWQDADPNEKLPCDQGEPEEEEPIFLVPPVEYLEMSGKSAGMCFDHVGTTRYRVDDGIWMQAFPKYLESVLEITGMELSLIHI